MLPYLTECYFNASASTSGFTLADKPRKKAAASMVRLLNAEDTNCFTFTSGATESNNWVFSSLAKSHKTGRILLSAVEHPSVTAPADELARIGFDVIQIPVDTQGVVHLDALQEALREDTILVSIMAANNETGVLEPIAEIGHLIREHCPNAIFHTDATQAVGKIPIDLQGDWEEVDLLSFSAHKFHGPKGIGGLYIRQGLDIHPLLLGGGQEKGLRAGTSNTAALAGLAAAASEASSSKFHKLCDLRDTFESCLLYEFPAATIYSRDALRLPNTSFFSLSGVHGEEMVASLAGNGIIIGTGSACSSGAIQFSKTLQAMGIEHKLAISSLRISFSKYSTIKDIEFLVNKLKTIHREQC